jgi:hypothetical protein
MKTVSLWTLLENASRMLASYSVPSMAKMWITSALNALAAETHSTINDD